MEQRTSKAEHVIEEVAGCGPFQVVILIVILFMCKSIVAYTVESMAFGSYNPGWKCMDNETEFSPTNYTGIKTMPSRNVTINDDDVYAVGTCDDYTKCNDVKFDPSTSTVVSEWGLICDDAWIVKLIISIQMLGMLIGACVSGFLSDSLIGRKKTLCLGMAVCFVFLLISSYSVVWSMFLIARFVIGICLANTLVLTFLYVSESMTRKWRAVTTVIPVWYIGSIVLALVSWINKDWRKVELFACAVTGLCLVPLVWIPESLRWLEVKHKSQNFIDVSMKILRCNRKPLPPYNIELTDTETECAQIQQDTKYTLCDRFRKGYKLIFRKGYKLITVCNVFLNFTTSLVYYAVTFGAKSLYGDFYFNLFVSNIIPLLLCLLAVFVMRKANRRIHSVVFYGLAAACSATSIGILKSGNDSVKDFGSTVLISVSRGALGGAWLGLLTRVSELYPTVMRGTAVGVGILSACVGGILAPLLVPNDKSGMYNFVIAMNAAALLCCLVSLPLPETKGKALKETFDDATGDERV